MIDVELFACSGGMAEGFRRAGLIFDLVVDASPDAVASYEANLGHRPVCMDVRELVRRAADFVTPIRLLVADPPCTPWSTAGKRQGLADERDMLRETCALIAQLRPEAYLIGNVPGLETRPNVGALQATIGALSGHGYCVRDACVLDAADYGVPQHRVRPFWYGHRAGPCIRWPEPTHGDARLAQLPGLGLRPWVTCRAALAHLPIEDLGRVVRGRATATDDYQRRHRTSLPQASRTIDLDRPAPTIQGAECRNARLPERERGVVRVDNPKHPPSRPDAPAYTLTASDRAQGGAVLAWPFDTPATTVYSGTNQLAPPGKGSPMSREWPWDVPATTVCRDERLEAPGHHPPSSKTVGGYVRLSERAGLIIQGFPEGWQLKAATKTARWQMLGMAMPPPLAEAVARSIIEQLGRTRVAAEARCG